MITIPTGDFVGTLSDVIPFACVEEELPQLHCVRLEWDGKLLHAMTTDRYRLGWATWDPDDEAVHEHQPALGTEWGGADDPWVIGVDLDDAKHLVKTYKLGLKEYYCPLAIDVGAGVIKVVRARDTGHAAITTVAPDRQMAEIPFPDLRKLLAENDVAVPTKELALNAKYVSDFAKVRPRGPMHMMLTGPQGMVHITIGKRFIGAIQPVREES